MQTVRVRTKLLPLAVAAAAMMLSACKNAPPLDSKEAARDEIAVYTAAYREFVGAEFRPDTSAETLYIAAQYQGRGDEAEMIEYLRPEVGEPLARAYARANSRGGWHAGPPVTARAHVVFAADTVLPRAIEYHAPVLNFSRPGFNASRDTALVEIGVRCGGLCGHWGMQLLVKGRDGRWYVRKRFFDAVA